MVGNIIVDQINKARNYPLASAFSLVITLVSMGCILLMISSGKKDVELNKKNSKEDTSDLLTQVAK